MHKKFMEKMHGSSAPRTPDPRKEINNLCRDARNARIHERLKTQSSSPARSLVTKWPVMLTK